MNIPKDVHYTKDHEWVTVEDSTATVGITKFAVEQLGDITLVEAPELGAEVEMGDTLSTIESVKAVSDLFSPISGKVLAFNDALEDAPETINDDPYGEGWILKIEMTNAQELERLMDDTAYRAFLDSLDD